MRSPSAGPPIKEIPTNGMIIYSNHISCSPVNGGGSKKTEESNIKDASITCVENINKKQFSHPMVKRRA